MQDVSDQLRLFGSAVTASGQGIAILSPAVETEAGGPRVQFVNDTFCAMYGLMRDEAIGQTPLIFGIIEQQQSIVSSMLRHIYDQQPFEAEVTARRRSGSEFELELQLVPVEDSGQITHWVVYLHDVTASRKQVIQLRHQAMHDTLTELPNRVLLMDRFDKAVDAARQSSSRVALLLMDLDRFKDVNDTFGHQFGDVLLKQVALRLSNQIAPSDFVARLGGDEFALLVSGAENDSELVKKAQQILNSLQQPFLIDGQVLEVAASIGIAVYPAHGTDVRTLLRRADLAMYGAKQAQAGYCFYRNDLESHTPDELSLVVEMRHAMENNEFELYYQPKLHMRSGLMTRAEVLIRWNHPQRGLLSPAAFIPIAEHTGLIRTMTDWIFDHAIEQCREWHADGVPVHVAINVSAKSLQEHTLPTKIHALLEKWKVEPRFIKIEITESSIMADPAHALAIASMLQSMGIRLSIDDFGTGYSSLTHLRELPIDEIKIDKSFVKDMTTSEADAVIVRTVIDLAHNLGKQVCAEGVEDEATWNMLADLGCDLAQGYWMSRPLPARAFREWLVSTGWGLGRRALSR